MLEPGFSTLLKKAVEEIRTVTLFFSRGPVRALSGSRVPVPPSVAISPFCARRLARIRLVSLTLLSESDSPSSSTATAFLLPPTTNPSRAVGLWLLYVLAATSFPPLQRSWHVHHFRSGRFGLDLLPALVDAEVLPIVRQQEWAERQQVQHGTREPQTRYTGRRQARNRGLWGKRERGSIRGALPQKSLRNFPE